MDKHANELIILERMVKERKASAKLGMVIGIPLTLVFVIGSVPSFFADDNFIPALLCGILLPGAIIGFLVFNYYRVESKITKMRTELGVGTDEEFESILKGCQKISDHVFIDNRYLIDFDGYTIIQLSDIRSCKCYTINNENSTNYGIKVITNDKQDNIIFSGEGSRDEAYKIITTVADFAEGQKYID